MAEFLSLFSTAGKSGDTVEHEERVPLSGESDNTRAAQVTIPMARKLNLESMGYIDCANSEILKFRYPHRTLRWKTANFLFLFRVLVHNSRVMWNHGKEEKMRTLEYLQELSTSMAPNPDRMNASIIENHPLGETKMQEETVDHLQGRRKELPDDTVLAFDCGKPMHKASFNSLEACPPPSKSIERGVGNQHLNSKHASLRKREGKGKRQNDFFSL